MTHCLTYDWRLGVPGARVGDLRRRGRSGGVRHSPRSGRAGVAAGRRPALRGRGGPDFGLTRQAFLPNEAILNLVGEGGGGNDFTKRTQWGGEGRGANRFAPSGCSALRGWPDRGGVGCGILRNEANWAGGWRTGARNVRQLNCLSVKWMRMSKGLRKQGMVLERTGDVLPNEANLDLGGGGRAIRRVLAGWREGMGFRAGGILRNEANGAAKRSSRIGLLRPTDGGCKPPARGIGNWYYRT